QAYQTDDQVLADFLQDRFPEPLSSAFPVWIEQHPLKNPDAAKSPFDLPEYSIPEQKQSAEADAIADEKFALALEYNQRGEHYTALTIGFAVVLFFAALASRMRGPRAQWALLALG